MDDRLDEILDRLRELDHRLARLEDERGHREHHHHHRDHRCHACGASRDRDDRRHHRGGDGDFQEKRVIDTIVRLVTEHVVRELDRRFPRREP
ncbi:hypothetical protein [Sandaracinus amylolyticus]|uniref:hypothetical protein n=1 Tax=Sandaracinus amylolyticus TaxID=927083 RepID=UPI001F171974|nr:hypothetical protein [Sandaracinus amylolyticus]UJR84360.1 Hypothetical protein I5071_64390 [Sandaracinus amylolyticus]